LVFNKGDGSLAVHIRLKRQGRKKRPFYRVVAIDSRTKRQGREIERLGWYDPVQSGLTVEFKEDRIFHWLKEGAIPTDTVNNLMRKKGLAYKWHLMNSGMSEADIAKEMETWASNQLQKAEKVAEKKAAEKEASKVEDVVEESVEVETAEEPVAEEPTEEVVEAAETTEEPVAEESTEEVVEATETAEEPVAEESTEEAVEAEETTEEPVAEESTEEAVEAESTDAADESTEEEKAE
jgi:small subunit ribosomal protein S16